VRISAGPGADGAGATDVREVTRRAAAAALRNENDAAYVQDADDDEDQDEDEDGVEADAFPQINPDDLS
jgi:hypothetical protein